VSIDPARGLSLTLTQVRGISSLMMSAWLNIRYLFDLCLWAAGSSSPHADGPSVGGGVRPREEEAATCRVSVTVNGRADTVRVPAATTLLALLRAHLGLTGTKDGCGVGECGAGTVLLDGEAMLACLVLAPEVDGCATHAWARG